MTLRLRNTGPGLAAIMFAACAVAAYAQTSGIEFKTTKLGDNLFMLQGKGGNLGLSVGADGVFLIDDDYAGLTQQVRAAVAEQTGQPVRFLINTHWHPDHTGGNVDLGGSGTVIVAQENVRKRLAAGQLITALGNTVPPSPHAGLPVITFDQSIRFHINGDTVNVSHVAPAHTDGDSFVTFKNANVMHTGDIYFNGFYPFIDTSSGGRLDGMIAATDEVLALVDDDTRIIPGHGPLSNKAEMLRYRNMLMAQRDAIKRLMDAGKSRAEVIAAKPSKQFDQQWGGGFLDPDTWVGIAYDSLL